MNENEPIKNQIQIDFEGSIAQKNKTISRLEKNEIVPLVLA